MGTYEDIQAMIKYLWEQEEAHHDAEPTDNHIFVAIKNVNEWLQSPSCTLVPEDEKGDD